MPDVLFCHAPLSSQSVQEQLGIVGTDIHDVSGSPIAQLRPGHSYVIESQLRQRDLAVARQLSDAETARNIAELSAALGDDETALAAEVMAQLYDYNIGLMGASTAVYGQRMENFAGTVKQYQHSLLKYREAMRQGVGNKAVAKVNAQKAFDKMQRRFQHELNMAENRTRARKGTVLSNSTRAMNIARSSRRASKLYVHDTVQASNLVKFSRYTKHLGNGLAVIDFGSRAGRVRNTYRAGGHWERELFIESSSFAASAYVGGAIVKGGLAFLLAATPVGWVGLIAGGIAIAGVAAGTSMATNSFAKNYGGRAYDSIMKYIKQL